MITRENAPQMGSAGKWRPLKGWINLLMGLAVLWFLAFVALPLGQRLPFVAPWMTIISEADINTTAYWYTQSEETAEAAMLVRNKMEAMK